MKNCSGYRYFLRKTTFLISFSGDSDTCGSFADVDVWHTFGGIGNVASFDAMTSAISGRGL